MDSQAATLIFSVIMSIGVAVWAVSLWLALSIGRPASNADSQQFNDDTELPFDDGTFADERGRLTLTGDPEALTKAFVLALKQSFFGQFPSIYLIKRHPDQTVVLKKSGPLMCNLPPALYFTDAVISFKRSTGNSVEVTYRLGFVRLFRLVKKITLGIILGIGLPVMLVVGSVIWHFVIPAADPVIRWQVLQTGQIVHVLWPPFMFMGFPSLGRARSKTWLENLLTNLDIEGDSR